MKYGYENDCPNRGVVHNYLKTRGSLVETAIFEARQHFKRKALEMHSMGLHDFGRWIDEWCEELMDHDRAVKEIERQNPVLCTTRPAAPAEGSEAGEPVAWAVEGENGGLCCLSAVKWVAEEDAKTLGSVVVPLYASPAPARQEGEGERCEPFCPTCGASLPAFRYGWPGGPHLTTPGEPPAPECPDRFHRPRATPAPARQDGVRGTSPTLSPISIAEIAKLKGYTGEACMECASFTITKDRKCDTCGATQRGRDHCDPKGA
jgi:hypothetical protein